MIGSVDSIESMTRSQLHSFHVRRYTPERMVVAVAGNVEHEHTVELVRAAFSGHLDRDVDPAPRRGGAIRLRTAPTLSLTKRDSEQAHLALGVRAFGRHEGHRWPLSVLNAAVGGGLSSRLFQEIREERGLAYSVYSGVDTFADTGAFSVYAGCQPENLGEVATLIREVLANVASDGITDAECARAKGSLRGSLVRGLEDSGSRMTRIGRSELNYGNHQSVPRRSRASTRSPPTRCARWRGCCCGVRSRTRSSDRNGASGTCRRRCGESSDRPGRHCRYIATRTTSAGSTDDVTVPLRPRSAPSRSGR